MHTDNTPPSSSSRLVIIDYEDVASSTVDLSPHLERAFGGSQNGTSSSPLGIIAIRNIPNFINAKQRLLPLAHTLAHLEPEYLEKHLSDPKSFYNAGWSHGKEKLGDKADFAKASYYFNPLSDKPGTDIEREQYPASYPCNKWPNEEEVPQLKGFQDAAKDLGEIMHKVVVLLAKHIDSMAERNVNGYTKDLLYNAMVKTEKAKGRLLYYYPLLPLGEEKKSEDNDLDEKEDNWIGWHNDSGFLTSLAGDMYVDDKTGKPLPQSEVDPQAGLYVTDQSGASIRVVVPQDCMAIQIGECVQILTGGLVRATPHCVRGVRNSSSVKVARISHPCFIDSKPTFPLTMPEGCSREDVVSGGSGEGKVPPLGERWSENGQTFGDFLHRSFEKYYNWKG